MKLKNISEFRANNIKIHNLLMEAHTQSGGPRKIYLDLGKLCQPSDNLKIATSTSYSSEDDLSELSPERSRSNIRK